MTYNTKARIGWLIIIILTVIPLLLWLLGSSLSVRFGSIYLALGSIGKISGIIAVVLFCANIFLTTRLSFIEDLFGGLNKVYIAHHLTGGIALCIALLHPIALSIQRASISLREGALLLLPRLDELAIALGIIALWIFIGLMIITFYLSLPYRVWLITHKFLGLVLLLMLLHVVLISSDVSNRPFLRTYLIVLMIIALIAYVYRTLLPRFFVRRYSYVITQTDTITSGVVRIYMKPLAQSVSFKPGQFIFMRINTNGVPREWHPFSISSHTLDNQLAVTVKSLGHYTDMLVKSAPQLVNSHVDVEGAYGRFNFRNFKAKKQVWIAGGIGITPFLPMIKDVTPDYKVDLYYCVKTEPEMIDVQQINQMALQSKGSFRFIPYIADKNGLITADTIVKESGDVKAAEILLCGPTAMINALKGQLKNQGISKRRIHSEEFTIFSD